MLEERDPRGDAVERVSDSAELGVDRAIRCAACGATVAHERDEMEVLGAHEHDRVNPGGYLYRIACFSRAEGARPVGDTSTEFPWFPHHAWRIAICAGCAVHLGWQFARGTSSFFGLIADRLDRRA